MGDGFSRVKIRGQDDGEGEGGHIMQEVYHIMQEVYDIMKGSMIMQEVCDIIQGIYDTVVTRPANDNGAGWVKVRDMGSGAADGADAIRCVLALTRCGNAISHSCTCTASTGVVASYGRPFCITIHPPV